MDVGINVERFKQLDNLIQVGQHPIACPIYNHCNQAPSFRSSPSTEVEFLPLLNVCVHDEVIWRTAMGLHAEPPHQPRGEGCGAATEPRQALCIIRSSLGYRLSEETWFPQNEAPGDKALTRVKSPIKGFRPEQLSPQLGNWVALKIREGELQFLLSFEEELQLQQYQDYQDQEYQENTLRLL